MIKAIAFDYGGVIELKDGDFLQEIVDSLQITKDDWQKTYFSFNHLSNTGKITNEELHKLVARELGATEAQVIFIQNLIEKYHTKKFLNVELIEIIKDLKKKNYKIGLMSNYSATLRDKLVKQNIIDLFDEIIISAEVGYQKPQPEIFKILSGKLGVDINELLFIDDTEKSLEGAEGIGYTPILYIDNKQLKEDISKNCI